MTWRAKTGEAALPLCFVCYMRGDGNDGDEQHTFLRCLGFRILFS